MEKNYELLHQKGFSRSNGLQFLSHILTFVQGDAQAKTQQIRDIYDRLKKEKFHVSSTYYGILGYLSLLGEHSNQAVDETIEVVRYLKTQKGFKWVDKNMNVLTATALVSSQYIEKFKENNELLETGIGISIETMIAAQTAALVASVSATTVAASAGS